MLCISSIEINKIKIVGNMKKSSFYFLLSAIALSGVFGLTACSSTEEEVVDNPNYDPLTKTVNANFVFSVSTGNTASTTRQSSASAQATIQETFRGIEEAQLAAFKMEESGQHVTEPTTAKKIYDLGAVLERGKLDPDGRGVDPTGAGVPLSHRVIELALPTETNTLMFWGKAPKDGTSEEEGEITFDASQTDISKHAFSLTPRVPKSSSSTSGQDAYVQYEKIITKAMNTIAQTKIANKDVKFGTETQHVTALSWKDYVDLSATPLKMKTTDPADATGKKPMSAMGIVLGNAFAAFHSITDGEIRGGSGAAIASMVGDLYQVITPVVNAEPASMQDAIAQQVGIAVKSNIELFFTKSTTPSWLAAETVVDNCGMERTQVNLVMADPNRDLNAFPKNFNVPMGVAQLTFAPSTCEWSYGDNQTHQTIGIGGMVTVFDYMYPAELCYFGNSGIHVTDQQKLPSQYPDGTAAWEKETSWAGWYKNSRVTASTRSVAMRDNINYGTALLESTVRYGSNILEDNNHAIQKAKNPQLLDTEEPNNQIQPTATALKLTGIIIGGQAQTMGWNYLAKDGASASFNSPIYDNSMVDETIPAYTAGGSKSTANYTMVWDNWSEAMRGQDQTTVYVALEFVNNTGKEFFGKDNKIPNGGTFYIVGKLDPDKKPADLKDVTDNEYKQNKSLGITWPEHYALPPYQADGSTLKERRVFMQDYMTTANFILNRESLQKAYVSVPDLRALQISLGMSVDLEWQTGLNFEVILGE